MEGGFTNSTDFKIENASIKADCLVLDSAMDNTISEALLQGIRFRYPSALGVTNTSNWRTFLQIGSLGTW